MQTYISGFALKIFFKFCSMIVQIKREKSLSKIFKKVLVWTKWRIVAQLQLNIIQAYISRSPIRFFFKLCSVVGLKKQIKTTLIIKKEYELEYMAQSQNSILKKILYVLTHNEPTITQARRSLNFSKRTAPLAFKLLGDWIDKSFVLIVISFVLWLLVSVVRLFTILMILDGQKALSLSSSPISFALLFFSDFQCSSRIQFQS